MYLKEETKTNLSLLGSVHVIDIEFGREDNISISLNFD
jgi:hypothetical protein